MKNFSIFERARTFSDIARTENLEHLSSISRRDFEGRESFVCRTTAASVEYGCLMIENALLLRTNRAGRVYAGVEKFSVLQPIIDRYLRIADISEAVYIFGEDDWKPPSHPNVRLINLDPSFRLTRESFLIAQSSSLNVAFIACRDTGYVRGQETYLALKTSNSSVVCSLTASIECMIDWTLAASF